MLNCLLNEGWFIIIFLLMILEIAYLREDVAYKDVAKD